MVVGLQLLMPLVKWLALEGASNTDSNHYGFEQCYTPVISLWIITPAAPRATVWVWLRWCLLVFCFSDLCSPYFVSDLLRSAG